MSNGSLKSLVYALTDREKLLERDALLACADRMLEVSGQAAVWEQKPLDNWMLFRRRGSTLATQGWKLHISATPLSAESVLTAVLPILSEADCQFKMVRTKRLLMSLNDVHSPRAAAGKFITIYPANEAEAVRLAEACHLATSTLAGPAILSDRRYRSGSLVHYRYGGFVPQTVYSADGRIVQVIRDPEGKPFPDAREAWFAPPPWLKDPFQPPEERGATEARPSAVLVGGRYEVTQALRHANKGGVYVATDRHTGGQVILKEARPGVGVDGQGRDVTDRLRIEARNLERLNALGVAPRLLDMFEAEGHFFITMEKLEGSPLRQMRRARMGALPRRELFDLAQSITALLDVCHDAGVLIRDFNPNNIMILPGGSPRIIDVELACLEDAPPSAAMGGFTPGYASPEQSGGAPPSRSDDLYSLAATLFFLATSRDPYLVPDVPASRTHHERIAEQLDAMIRGGVVPEGLREPILGGLVAKPEARWRTKQVLSHLEPHAAVEDVAVPVSPAKSRLGGARWEGRERCLAVISDLVSATLGAIRFENAERPVDGSCAALLFDPLCVQYGAAGIGVFLTSTLPLLDDAGRGTLARLATWVAEESRKPMQRPQGLYFGVAGAAVFLLDAAEALGDEVLRARACELARSLRPLPGLVDVTHGASGIGLALLHFYRVTGQADFLDGARRLGDAILEREEASTVGAVWPQPDSSGSLATFYGFAHGVAGIAYFLLTLWAATREERFLAASQRGGKTLVQTVHQVEDRAYWPHGPTRPTLWTYWCNGSSGVGTTLVRLYQVTGEARYRELAELAANAVYTHRWFSGVGQCHGLAGNGEFLLDLHRRLGGERYLAMAQELTETLFMHRIYRDNRAVFTDDTGMMVSPDFAVGWTGVGSFLYRVAMGGPRCFMVDELLDSTVPHERTAPLMAARS